MRVAEEKVAEEKVAEDSSGRERGRRTVVEEKVAEEKVVEEKVAEEKVVEEKLAEEKVEEEKVVEEKLAEEKGAWEAKHGSPFQVDDVIANSRSTYSRSPPSYSISLKWIHFYYKSLVGLFAMLDYKLLYSKLLTLIHFKGAGSRDRILIKHVREPLNNSLNHDG